MTFTLNQTGVCRDKSGFTLVEIMIVVTIIGLLAVLALPIWGRARRNSQSNAFINDLRIGIQSAQSCIMENGAWPAETAAGVQPPELNGYVNTSFWSKPTPVGGQWDWDYQQSGFTAALAVINPNDTTLMALVDEKFDDGSLTTGNFRQLSASKYVYILQ